MSARPARLGALALVGALSAVTTATRAADTGPVAGAAFERPVRVASPGRVAVRLDRDVYEAARPDLGDLRVVDEAGRLVPYLLDRGETTAREEERRPTLRNQGRTDRGEATADLDFGQSAPKTRLTLRLSGDNFRRAVSVAGSVDGREWTTLVDEAWVFAVPGSDAARYESVDLPPNDFPLLRVRVRPGPDEKGRPAIEDAWAPAERHRPMREEGIAPRFAKADDAPGHETWLTLDLGAAHQPFHAVELDVADPRFFREAIVEARRDRSGGSAGAFVVWVEIGRGALYRLGRPERPSECLRLPVSGRERTLRVRLRNRDDRPLTVRGVAVRVPVERVVFEAAAGSEYRILYGSTAPAPVFDLERTVGDAAAWAASATEASLDPPRRLSAAATATKPWTERHPALLWIGLVTVVAALGALTWRAITPG